MGFKYRVREDGVVVLPDEGETVSKGGVYIAPQAQQKPSSGKVIAVGPDVKPEDVKVGDTVVYGRYAGHEIPVKSEEKTCILLRLSDIRLVEIQ